MQTRLNAKQQVSRAKKDTVHTLQASGTTALGQTHVQVTASCAVANSFAAQQSRKEGSDQQAALSLLAGGNRLMKFLIATAIANELGAAPFTIPNLISKVGVQRKPIPGEGDDRGEQVSPG